MIALNADPVLLTAWANDVSYDKVFSRQVEAFGQPGDVLILISTSGKSKNLVEACKAARAAGITCLALLGKDGGDLANTGRPFSGGPGDGYRAHSGNADPGAPPGL